MSAISLLAFAFRPPIRPFMAEMAASSRPRGTTATAASGSAGHRCGLPAS